MIGVDTPITPIVMNTTAPGGAPPRRINYLKEREQVICPARRPSKARRGGITIDGI